MPQASIWEPTRNLVRAIAKRMSAIAERPVKQNEIIDLALRAFAQTHTGMTTTEVEEALRTVVSRRVIS